MSNLSLNDLAAAFRGERRALTTGTLRNLGTAGDAAWAASLPGRLDAIAGRLDDSQVTITFGGHFSSGKSTVINALLGRPLLPTSDYPETGVACIISAGPVERAAAVRRGRAESLAVSAEAIAQVVSLVDSAGGYRAEVSAVTEVEIALAGSVLPPGLTVIDSPGIDDTAAMTERATAAADRADLLVWVVNSRQALSETEQWFLAEHLPGEVAERIIVVVNVFLKADTGDQWNWFLKERAPAIHARILTALGPGSGVTAAEPAILFVCGRAALGMPSGFGATVVRDAVTGLRRDTARVRAARLSRARVELEVLLSEIEERINQEKKRQQRLQTDRNERFAAVKCRQDAAKAAARQTAAAFARLDAGVDESVAATVADITRSLQRDGAHGRDLTRRLRAVSQDIAAQVIHDLERCARQHGLPAPSAQTGSQVRALLTPAPVSVTVPNNPAVRKGKGAGGAGAVIGGVVGSILFPGAGTLIGAAIGGAVGSAASDDGIAAALAQDRAGAQASARAAGAAALADLSGKREGVRRLVLADACFQPPPRAAGDAAGLHALLALREKLLRIRDRCRLMAA